MDESQPRLELAAPLPLADLVMRQSFAAMHDGLSAIELLLVVYPPAEEGAPPAGAGGADYLLTLRLLDPGGDELHSASWDSRLLTHNDPLWFHFPPVPRSSGDTFFLQIEGGEQNRATCWGYSLDGYTRGQLEVNGDPWSGDLRFQTRYRYSIGSAMTDLVSLGGRALGYVVPLALLLLISGYGLASLVPLHGHDAAVRLGVAVAGGLAALPLAWLWWSVVGGRWNGWLLGAALVVMAAWLTLRRKRRRIRLRLDTTMVALGVILLAGTAARLLAIRDLVLPAWVDSPQHHLIAQLMADTGRAPSGYRPWMPVDAFWYHFGYHALAASWHQLTGQPMAKILLVGGQLLNSLAPLTVYAGTVMLTRRKRAGLIAAFFVALLSLFPGYYTTWGRYTQLCGMLMFPPIIGVSYQLFSSIEERCCNRCWRPALWVGLLLGGLFLVHARVWVFGTVWLLMLPVGQWASRPGRWTQEEMRIPSPAPGTEPMPRARSAPNLCCLDGSGSGDCCLKCFALDGSGGSARLAVPAVRAPAMERLPPRQTISPGGTWSTAGSRYGWAWRSSLCCGPSGAESDQFCCCRAGWRQSQDLSTPDFRRWAW